MTNVINLPPRISLLERDDDIELTLDFARLAAKHVNLEGKSEDECFQVAVDLTTELVDMCQSYGITHNYLGDIMENEAVEPVIVERMKEMGIV